MTLILIAIVALCASLLTFFSGFGLGTLLTPVLGLFFPIHVAIALTGIVHLLNNLFKLVLVGKHLDRSTVLRFGLPSVVGGLAGAWLLSLLTTIPAWHTWTLGAKVCEVTPLKLVIAVVLLFFALMEIIPSWANWRFSEQYLLPGGLLSGFFGGLSGNQGALRSAFLVQLSLKKEAFIASGVVIACMVDLTRLPIYFSRFDQAALWREWPLLLTATLSAFIGAYLGAKFLKKLTLSTIQRFTAAMIMLIAVLLGLGIL